MKRSNSVSRSLAAQFTKVALYSFLPLLVIVVLTIALFYRTSVTYVSTSIKNAATGLHAMIEKNLETAINSYLRSKTETAINLFEQTNTAHLGSHPLESDDVKQSISILSKLKVGKRGYYYAVDSSGNMMFHPQPELVGKNLAEVEPVKTQIQMKDGYLEYMWQNPDESKVHQKALYMIYFPKFDWIVSATSYKEDFISIIDKSVLKDITNKANIGKTGYSYIFNREGEQIAHPYLNKSDLKGILSNEEYMALINRMFKVKNGLIEYYWRDSADVKKSRKIVYLKYLKDFDWIVGTSIYKNEIMTPVYVTLGAYIITALFTTLFVFLYILHINKEIEVSIKHINTILKSARDGDLSIRSNAKSFTELEEIGNNVDFLLSTLEITTNELGALNTSLEEKILERTKELESTTEKLIESEKQSITSKIIAGIAHEINTPIGVAITAASFHNSILEKLREQLKEKLDEKYYEQCRDSIQITLRNLEKAAKLISRLKNISMDLEYHEKKTFILKNIIEHVISDLSPLTATKNINFKINISDFAVFSYPELIRIIFINLIHNSIYHGYKEKNKGTIEISATLNDEKVIIVYTDSGKGIPEKEQNRVFDLFYTTSRKDGKSGIGLSVVNNIVENFMHGTISLESSPEKYTRFTIEFPSKPAS